MKSKSTKSIRFAILLLVSFSSWRCKNNDLIDSCNSNYQQTYNYKGITLTLSEEEWYLTRFGKNGLKVNLKISGYTNGNSISIESYGDGLNGNMGIELSPEKTFETDIEISFTAASVPKGDFTKETIMYVYKNKDTLKVNLLSCPLHIK